ncbi:MAG: VCBS repeat-containing protein [Planctomycetes bacterium]|nr:VCBS repeat-containing protein [Planctomycetota bacterium]MCB9918901.1 VCBS repeat-containing protein [Planctomycetota bacterium]
MRKSTICVVLCSTRLLAQGVPFETPRAITGGFYFPSVAAAVDVDLDGHRDVIAANGISIDPRGPFEAILLDKNSTVRTHAPAPPTGELGLHGHVAVVTGKTDDDSLEDFVVVSDGGTVSTYRNPGPGPRPACMPRFDKPVAMARVDTMTGRSNSLLFCRFWRVEAVDIDGDGRIEVVQSHRLITIFEVVDRSGLTAFHHVGDPTKIHEATLLTGDVRDFASGDYDGDGDVDFVAIRGEKAVVHAWNDGGRFRETEYQSLEPAHPARIARCDVDDDGIDEAVLADATHTTIWVHSRDPKSASVTRRSYDLDRPFGTRVEEIIAVDYDADGDEDVVVQVLDASNGSCLVFFENDQGNLKRLSTVMTTNWEVGQNEYPIHAARTQPCDIDQDGRTDLLFGGMRDRVRSNFASWIVEGSHAASRGAKFLVEGSHGSHGHRATLSFANDPRLGNRHFGVRVAGLPARRLAALLLDWRAMHYRTAGVDLIAGAWNSFGTTTRGAGDDGWSEVVFDIPRDPSLLKLDFRFQWVYADPAAPNPLGISTSAGWSLALRR